MQANRDDVDQFDLRYINVTGANTLAMDANWGFEGLPINIKSAVDFTDEEKTAYIQKSLAVKYINESLSEEDRRLQFETKQRERDKARIERQAEIDKLHRTDPQNTWWGPDHNSRRRYKDTVMHVDDAALRELLRLGNTQ
jgi:hypothetical protein